MKKLLGLLFAVLIFAAPLAMRAEIEATAGSMKVGVHMDLSYRWSPEVNKNPTFDQRTMKMEQSWRGYDTFSAGDLMLQITGKVGDRISYKILEGLIYGTFEHEWGTGDDGGVVKNIWPMPKMNDEGPFVAPFEAYVDFQAMDKLKLRFGKTIIPTLLANTGVHKARVIKTANPPLIADRIMGVNEVLVNMNMPMMFPVFTRIPLPLDVTGAGVITNPIEGLEAELYFYDSWVMAQESMDGMIVGQDLGFDFNRSKGWDLAATYNRDIFSGNLTVRGFYFSEYIDLSYFADGMIPHGRNSGWGLGVAYDAPKWFAAVEYTANTLHYFDKPILANSKTNTWKGYYIQAGLNIGPIQPVIRYDWIDYASISDDDVISITKISSADNEVWYTIGVNYLVNDNATVGLDYVIKRPETPKVFGHKSNGLDVSEIVVMLELDLL